MKALYLLRHGKAGWGDVGASDHDRPLEDEGVIASKRLGLHMVEHNIAPDLVLHSSAKRVVETLAALSSAAPQHWHTQEHKDIYNADKMSLMNLIKCADDKVETLMVIGHNPTMHELAFNLVGDGDERLRNRLMQGYPSGTIVGIAFDIKRWQDLTDHSGTITHLDSPDEMPIDF